MHGIITHKNIKGLLVAKVPETPIAYQTNMSASNWTGTAITAGVTNTLGSFQVLFPSTNAITYGLWLWCSGAIASSATAPGFLMDIAVGVTSSEVVHIPQINCGNSSNVVDAKLFYFPGLNIPAGSRITARAQSSISGIDQNVLVHLDQGLQHVIATSTWSAYGADVTTSYGVSIPSGAVLNQWGVWTLVATTTRDHYMWGFGLDSRGDITLNANTHITQIGYGPTETQVTIIGTAQSWETTIEEINWGWPPIQYKYVPSGSKLWARMSVQTIPSESRGIVINAN